MVRMVENVSSCSILHREKEESIRKKQSSISKCAWLVAKHILYTPLRLGGAFLLLMAVGCSTNHLVDLPPSLSDPPAGQYITIRALKNLYRGYKSRDSTALYPLRADLYISGIVVANDKGGNFHKQIVLQDSTAGISLALDGRFLYNEFPIGRQISVSLGGLILGSDAGVIQIAYQEKQTSLQFLSMLGIPRRLFDRYITKGPFDQIVQPYKVTLQDLLADGMYNRYQSTLIELVGATFEDSLLGKPFAVPGEEDLSRNLLHPRDTTDTRNPRIIAIRTSKYAQFAGQSVPSGQGTVRGIFSPFLRNLQIKLRSIDDITFANE